MTYWIHQNATMTFITYYEDDVEEYILEKYGDCEWGSLWEIKDERTNDTSSKNKKELLQKAHKKKRKLVLRDELLEHLLKKGVTKNI